MRFVGRGSECIGFFAVSVKAGAAGSSSTEGGSKMPNAFSGETESVVTGTAMNLQHALSRSVMMRLIANEEGSNLIPLCYTPTAFFLQNIGLEDF
jgi:hypothetical protein